MHSGPGSVNPDGFGREFISCFVRRVKQTRILTAPQLQPYSSQQNYVLLRFFKSVFVTLTGPCIADIFSRVQPTRCNVSQFLYFCKTLNMFQTVFPSIIRSSKLHILRQVYLSGQYCYLLLAAGSTVAFTCVQRKTRCFH